MSGAKLVRANLSGAYLSGADLTGSDLEGANLAGAFLVAARMSGAKLAEADLSGAILNYAHLSEARIWGTDLAKASFWHTQLWRTIFEPSSMDGIRGIEFASGLSTLKFSDSPTAIVFMREDFRKRGLHAQARELTYAIRHQQRVRDWSEWDTVVEAAFNYVAFEVTCAYGLQRGRPLVLLGMLIPMFSILYMLALIDPGRRAGIWRLWAPDRVLRDEGGTEPVRLAAGGERWKGGPRRPLSYRVLRVVALATYMSILSAFHIGWRDLNVGTWIARLQPREYTLRTTGWVRCVSGLQSLLSVYLLALWVFVYFGRPFD